MFYRRLVASADGSNITLNPEQLALSSQVSLLQNNSDDSKHAPTTAFIVTSRDDNVAQLQVVAAKPAEQSEESSAVCETNGTRIAPKPADAANDTAAGEKTKLECSHCGKTFAKNFDLQQHVRCAVTPP